MPNDIDSPEITPRAQNQAEIKALKERVALLETNMQRITKAIEAIEDFNDYDFIGK